MNNSQEICDFFNLNFSTQILLTLFLSNIFITINANYDNFFESSPMKGKTSSPIIHNIDSKYLKKFLPHSKYKY